MNKKNILLVEDNAIIGMNEKLILERENYKVTHCMSGEKAIEAIKTNQDFDIILMDIDLGKGINGVETAEIILKEYDIPIVFVSSHQEKEIIEKTERINSYGYLVKNSPDTVIVTVIKMAFKLFETNKKLEKTLKETKEKEIVLESILNSIPDFIGILSPDFKILKSNRSIYDFLGIEKKDNNHYHDLFNKQKEEQLFSFFDEFVKIEEIYKKEIYKNNKYFEVMLYPIIEEDGTIINYLEHIVDITEEKEISKKIEMHRDLLEITLQSIGDGVIVTNCNGEITMMNKIAEYLTGYSFVDSQNKNLSEIFKIYDANTLNPISDIIESIVQKKEKFKLNFGTLLIDRKGNKYNIADSFAPIKDKNGSIKGIIIVFSDITTTYNLNNELKLKDNILNSILKINPHFMIYQILSDKNNKTKRKFTFLTDSVQNLYGVTEEEAKNNPDLIYGRIFEEDRKKLELKEEEALLNDSYFSIEIRMLNPDNSIRWSRFTSVPVKISETETLWNGIEINITKEKEKRDLLNNIIKENDLILQEVYHRIKNNLNIILSLLRFQEQQYKDEEIKNVFKQSYSKIKSISVLYDKLYLTKNKKELSTKSYFSSLIDGIIEIFPKIIDLKIEKEIEDLSINEKTLSIVGIILNELITNSIKHAFVDRISGVISFCLSKINGKIKVIYKDNGVGMPESFFTDNKDTGFGLNLIKMLVCQLDGSISFSNKNGAEYTIIFPI